MKRRMPRRRTRRPRTHRARTLRARTLRARTLRARTPLALFGLGLLLVACDEDPPTDSQGTDVVEDAAGDTAPDVIDDAEPDAVDTAEEVAEDVADTTEVGEDATEEVVEDVTDTAAEVGDVADTAADVIDEEVAEVDAGTDCSEDAERCTDPYACIDGVCRVPLQNTTWSESDFGITEPEELTSIFDFFKTFADDVRFLVIDLGEGPTPITGTYGAADVVDGDAIPIQVRYQPEYTPGSITFRPAVDDESPLDGETWVSDPFLYELRATATIEVGDMDPITAGFGLDALEVEIFISPATVPDELNTARLVGAVTRAETESRVLADADEIDDFLLLFCTADRSWDPGLEWNLSDVLDCNGAELDVDTDGDTVLDAYRVVIDATFDPAELVGD